MAFAFLVLLSCGWDHAPQFTSAELTTAEKELNNATTQVEMTGAAGGIAECSRNLMLEALDYRLSKLSKTERSQLLQEQYDWHFYMQRRNSYPMGKFSMTPMLGYLREASRHKYRFEELACPNDTYNAYQKIKDAPIKFNKSAKPLFWGELDIHIPKDKRKTDSADLETVGQLLPRFCRIIKKDTDEYWIGIIVPTNYSVVSSFGLGTETNLCIWKNGQNVANHIIGKEITIKKLELKGNIIIIRYRQDEKQSPMIAEFNLTAENKNEIQINHWTTETSE